MTLFTTIKRNLLLLAYSAFPAPATAIRLARNRRRRKDRKRFLEIGPGEEVLPDFERYNIRQDGQSDYIGNADVLSIFNDGEFDMVYASHVFEHIPWYQSLQTLCEWSRIIKKGGSLEIWVPDGLKIASAYVEASLRNGQEFRMDGWYRFNDEKSHDLWFSGRIFSYGDGTGTAANPNWHRAIFSERYLASLLDKAGFSQITKLGPSDIRGHDHGWINLGLRAIK